MNDLLVNAIVGLLLSMGVGVFTNLLQPDIRKSLSRLLGIPIEQKQETYSDKILRLNETLSKSSKEVDNVIKEMALFGQERANSVKKLEQQLEELSMREQQAKARIQTLEKVPVEALQYFEQILEKGDKRSAWRDYKLFGLGVVVSTIIAIGLKLVGF